MHLSSGVKKERKKKKLKRKNECRSSFINSSKQEMGKEMILPSHRKVILRGEKLPSFSSVGVVSDSRVPQGEAWFNYFTVKILCEDLDKTEQGVCRTTACRLYVLKIEHPPPNNCEQ